MEWVPCGLMVKAMDGGIVVALLCSLLDKYPPEKYELSYLPSDGLNSTTTALERWLWY